MLQEFKKFLLRGNVIDLAVAVVIGAAFTTVIEAFTKGFITPLLGLFGGSNQFANRVFTIRGQDFLYGGLIDSIIYFVIVAAVIFFLVIQPMNFLIARSRKEPPADPTTKKCPECLSEIPIDARRCAFCTSQL
ncbi:MAG: large conductance mechanosensitive channel protein MscL [Dehalococcoidia bacterium]|nr:large conductance mechanosensitive channel protein MscL [Dehalococcoidia bacterium]